MSPPGRRTGRPGLTADDAPETSAAAKPLDLDSQARTATQAVVAVERSCDLAWLHLLGAGLVSSRPDDLVTATLRTILLQAQEAEGPHRPPARRWAA